MTDNFIQVTFVIFLSLYIPKNRSLDRANIHEFFFDRQFVNYLL